MEPRGRERHGRLRREGSGRAQRELPRYNGAAGRERHRWANRKVEMGGST